MSVGTDAVKGCMCTRVGVGLQQRCKTCQSLRGLENQGTVSFTFSFSTVTMMVDEIDLLVRGGEP